jgi:starch-binding outer membrane protein, SusD/RagB family
MKYTIFRSLAAALLLSGMAACDGQLDLQPAQSVSEELSLSTDANVKTVLLGCYDALAQNGLWGGNVIRDGELLGANGEVNWVGTFNGPREVFNLSMIAENGEAENMWLDAYDCINRCNNVLSALDVVNADDKAQVEGEARFCRAATYFELVRFYGKPYEAGGANAQLGVPNVTTPTRGITEENSVRRNTVAENYAQIVADLEAASTLLPEDNGVRANKYAAEALLARVFLQMGRYSDASTRAASVIGSGFYSLNSNYADGWNNDDNTIEDIFAIQVSSQDADQATLVTFFSIPEFGGRDGDIEINQPHLDLYEAGDTRADFFYEGNGATRTGKWRNQYSNQPILRLAEMHLIRAEASVRAGGNGDADINPLRARAGVPALANATLDQVLMERRRELAMEGHRIHDIKRLKGTSNGLAYDADKLVFPIPAREIAANKNLIQNDGY